MYIHVQYSRVHGCNFCLYPADLPALSLTHRASTAAAQAPADPRRRHVTAATDLRADTHTRRSTRRTTAADTGTCQLADGWAVPDAGLL